MLQFWCKYPHLPLVVAFHSLGMGAGKTERSHHTIDPSRASGGSPTLALTLYGGGIAWCQRRPFFRRMPMGPEAFLELPGSSELRPCVRTRFKKRPCAKIVWLVGRTRNRARLQFWKPG